MKKILLVVAVATLSIVGVNAQSFGVKGGYNYATLKGELAEKLKLAGTHGFYVGGVVELPLSDIFAVQPEVVYSRQGFGAEILNKKYKLTMDYVNVPVFAKIKFGESFSLQGGPQFGFLVNDPEISGESVSLKLGKKAFGTFDFGVGVGASFKLENGLFLDARYTHGFTNVFDNDNRNVQTFTTSKDANFKNSVLSVGLGFMF